MKKTSYCIFWIPRLIILILVFTGVDYLFHSLLPQWAVPEYYFKNKIIFGFLWSILALFASFEFHKIKYKALVFSLIVSIVLQLRYYLEGYSLGFVLTFLVIHFAIFYVLSFVMFNSIDKEYDCPLRAL